MPSEFAVAVAEAARPAREGLPAAVLWDMDGTLVDSEPYWIGAEYALAASCGADWNDTYAHELVGNSLLDSAAIFDARTGIGWPPERIASWLLDQVTDRMRAAVPWRPGARELLIGLRGLGVPCALVTASWSPLVEAFLAGAPARCFDTVVTGDRVTWGKPHPQSYVLAAAELGVGPADCVAVEDSVPGATAAVAAGVPTIGVAHLVDLGGVPGLRIVDTLAGIGPYDLLRIAHAEPAFAG